MALASAPQLGDRELPFVDTVCSAQGMTRLLNGRVLPTIGREPVNEAVTIEHVAYWPGETCVVRCDRPAAGVFAIATLSGDGELEATYRRHYGEASRAAAYLADERCLVEFFPADWMLPSLAWIVDPLHARDLLTSLPDPAVSRAFASGCEVTLLTYRPHTRAVVCYTPAGASSAGGTAVVGKIYRSASKARTVWNNLRALHAQAAASELVLPKPLALVEERGLLLMERLAGPSLRQVLERDSTPASIDKVAQHAAGALAALHALDSESLKVKVRTLAREVRRTREQAERVAAVAPLLAQQVAASLDRLAPSIPRASSDALRVAHADYALHQLLLLRRDRVGMLDFDKLSLGDPALDVSCFNAKVHRDAARTGRPELRRLAASFLAEYERRSGDVGLADRVRVIECVQLLRAAVRKFRVDPRAYAREGPSSLPNLLLGEAADRIARL